MSPAERIIRRFAVSDALYRGTALSANLILISIIATEKGFGAEGVLISAFIQFLISGLLEIPAGRFADRTGWYKSIRLGLSLKIATTLCYIGAVLCVYTIGARWAWVLIAAESVIDSFANAFINGAYQAAYGHWYAHHVKLNGISKSDAPPLFVASFQYSIVLRLLLPAAALAMGTLLFYYSPAKGNSLAIYLLLLSYVLALRFFVIRSVAADLGPLSSLQAAESGSRPHPPLIEIVESGFNSLLLYAFATLSTVACGFYLYGEIYRSLSSLLPEVGALWIGGTLIGLMINVGSILLSRSIARRAQAASSGQIKRLLPAFIGGLSLGSLGLLLFFASETLHVAILFAYSLIVTTASSLILRWIASHDTEALRPEVRATWLSVGEVMGLLAFGFLAGLSLWSGIPRAGLWTLLIFLGLGGPGLSLWSVMSKSDGTGEKITLKQYLGISVLGTACTFFIIISIFDARSFIQTSRTIKQDGHQLLLQVLKSGLREPVIQGSFTETAARLDGIMLGRNDICIEVSIEERMIGNCAGFKKRAHIRHFTETIFFDEASGNAAAQIHFFGDYSDIQSRARRRLVGGLLGYLFLGFALFLVVVLSSRRIFHEIERLHGEGSSDEPRFLIHEFWQLAAKLAASRKQKDELLRMAATAEIASQVAHDIRSPLAALDAALKDAAHLPEEKRTLLRAASGRIRDIAEGLLERHRESRTAGRAPAETSALQPLIDSVIEEKRLLIPKEVNLTTAGNNDAGGIFAVVDSAAFKRVLSNLLNNAIESLNVDGKICVEIKADTGLVNVTVTDDGKGIPPEILARLGERGVSWGKEGGSGLGLSHAKAFAEAHGGRLEIASDIGRGASAALILPRSPAPSWFVPEIVVTGGGSVVVLDDDPGIHAVWETRFKGVNSEQAGVVLHHFSEPDELRRWVRSKPELAHESLCLFDFELGRPKITGLELARELGLLTKMILVTGRAEDPAVISECAAAGVRLLSKSQAVRVPLRCVAASATDCVLVDDDELVRKVWAMAAKRAGKRLTAFRTTAECLEAAARLDRDTAIYLDSHLGPDERGEDLALELHTRGFRRIYMATGRDEAALNSPPWLAGVIGKEPPWA